MFEEREPELDASEPEGRQSISTGGKEGDRRPRATIEDVLAPFGWCFISAIVTVVRAWVGVAGDTSVQPPVIELRVHPFPDPARSLSDRRGPSDWDMDHPGLCRIETPARDLTVIPRGLILRPQT